MTGRVVPSYNNSFLYLEVFLVFKILQYLICENAQSAVNTTEHIVS